MPLHVGQKGEFSTTDPTLVLFHTLMSQGMLFEMMRLYKFHATLRADIGSDVLVLHHMILKLAWVLKCLITLSTVILHGATMYSQMSFKLYKCGEV